MKAKATHCPNGHEYTTDNLLWSKNRGKVRRRCKACYIEYQNALKASANYERPSVSTGPYNPHPIGIAVRAPGWGWTPLPLKPILLKEGKNAWH